MGRKGNSITLSISDRDKAELEKLAVEFGILWGDRPNISRLVEGIAQKKLLLAKNNDWTNDRIHVLNLARNLLIDRGMIEEALVIAKLLNERNEVTSIALRSELKTFIDSPSHPNRIQIERYCKQQQPFKLSYQDPSERQLRFTVHYAQISYYEDREYLECWCQESENNRSIPELQHNWCFRLDRVINETLISPSKGLWRKGLDKIEVEILFFHELAFNYQTKTDADILNEWLPEKSCRRVIRRVFNEFWLFRDLRRYGENCILASPESLRNKFVLELSNLIELYQGNLDKTIY